MIKWLAVKLPSEIPGRKREELLARLPLERKLALERGGASETKQLGPLFAYALLRYALEGKNLRVTWKSGEKPVFEGETGLYFSLSHTDGLALCALSDTPCGADAERIRAVKERVWQRTMSDGELKWAAGDLAKLMKLWSLKESWMKLTGKGLALWPGKIEFSFDGEKPIAPSKEVACMCTVIGDCAVAICVKTEEKIPPIRMIEWEEVIEY